MLMRADKEERLVRAEKLREWSRRAKTRYVVLELCGQHGVRATVLMTTDRTAVDESQSRVESRDEPDQIGVSPLPPPPAKIFHPRPFTALRTAHVAAVKL